MLHRKVDRDVAALRDESDARRSVLSAVLVRPKSHAIKVIDEAMTVRTNDWHIASRISQRLLQLLSRFTGFGEPRCETNCAGSFNARQCANDLERCSGWRGNKAGVRYAGQFGDTRVAGKAGKFFAPWVNGPQLAIVVDIPALLYDQRSTRAAENGHRSGSQHFLQSL